MLDYGGAKKTEPCWSKRADGLTWSLEDHGAARGLLIRAKMGGKKVVKMEWHEWPG